MKIKLQSLLLIFFLIASISFSQTRYMDEVFCDIEIESDSASKDVIFMHCLPANRGQEVTSDVLDGKNSIVLQQAKNRMYIQQAILLYVIKK